MAHPHGLPPIEGDPALAGLAKRFMAVMHLLEARNRENEALALMNEAGLTVSQLIALHVLKMHGAHTVGDIAAEARLSKAATSQMIERLVALGFVSRTEDERDRRQKQVSLTPKGSDLMDRIFLGRIRSLMTGFGALASETREHLTTALEEVCRDLGHEGLCCARDTTGGER